MDEARILRRLWRYVGGKSRIARMPSFRTLAHAPEFVCDRCPHR